MESCRCDFCLDLRNVEPAKYIGCEDTDEEFQKFINEAKEEKKFVCHYPKNEEEMVFGIIDKCPVCGYEFTEKDYDEYF